MNSGVRNRVQRARRARVKADADVLLARLLARHFLTFTSQERDEIGEMRMRLAPPKGQAAPINLTGYTK